MVPATWSGATERRNRDVQTTMGVVHGYDRNYPALTSIAPHGHSHGGRITTTPAAERPRTRRPRDHISRGHMAAHARSCSTIDLWPDT